MGIPSGPGALEVIWYIKSAFSEKVLDSIPKSLALDERAWTKWNEEKDKFIESLERFKESEDVFSAWKGGNIIAEDDIPVFPPQSNIAIITLPFPPFPFSPFNPTYDKNSNKTVPSSHFLKFLQLTGIISFSKDAVLGYR